MNILNPRKRKNQPLDRYTTTSKLWIWGFVIFGLGFFLLYILLHANVFSVFGTYLSTLKKLSLGGGLACLILLVARIVENSISRKPERIMNRYNLIRLVRLLAVVIILLVAISLLFENWYTAAVSLGLISLLVGFALQTPMTSLIGWLYIVIRTPYHVGDRIQIDTFKGDIVEINYLDTTLWEFGGDYLTNDLPTGRLIRFPNSLVLQAAVFNYSWQKFPYLWNEIPFHIAYESDLRYVEEVLKRVTKEELDKDMDEKIENLKNYMQGTPISEVDIKEYPFVAFRINTNTWVEAMVTYLVKPKKAADTRSRIIKKALGELLLQPDKVMFPKSNAR